MYLMNNATFGIQRIPILDPLRRVKIGLIVPTLRDSSFMAAPPYLMTMVFPRNFCRYGSASERMDTRSKGLNFDCETQWQSQSMCSETGGTGIR